jgi:intracellular sulfur oxidation DsrE/DsrF family protein
MAHHVKLRVRISAWVATEAAMVVVRNVPNWASIHAAMDLAVMAHRAAVHVVDRTVTVCAHSAMMGHHRQSMVCGTRLKAIGRANPRTESFFWKCTKTSRMRVAL